MRSSVRDDASFVSVASRFLTVQVEEHDALPDGCSKRFRATDEGRPVTRVSYESEAGVGGAWDVQGVNADGSTFTPTVYPVDDSSEGTSMLVVGGDHGLRLTSQETNDVVAEPYLLLARSALLDVS